jgi:hypothetical protein
VIGHEVCGYVNTFTAGGYSLGDGESNHWENLIPTPIEPKKKGVVWVNVYKDGSSNSYRTREEALVWLEYSIARIRVEWEEGRFDE